MLRSIVLLILLLPLQTIAQPKKSPGSPARTKETLLSVFLTDSSGNYYGSAPYLQFHERKSGKLIKKCYRTLDSNGSPNPLNISPGTYDLKIGARAAMISRRIVVEANNHNKVFIVVGKGTLRFRCEEADYKTTPCPANEFEAHIMLRSEPGSDLVQNCSEDGQYAPGEYYVEVNTVPIVRFNVDIDFGLITEIQLPHHVSLQITNTEALGTVTLYSINALKEGETIRKVQDMKVNGSMADQRLQIRPGTYEARWISDKTELVILEKKMRFTVRPNEDGIIELK